MNPEKLQGLMSSRRSVREYLPDPLPEGALDRILSAATLSPSGADRLPFTFIIIEGQEMKDTIRERSERVDKQWHENMDAKMGSWMKGKKISFEKPFLTQAPVLLLVAGDTEQPYWRESTWLSIAYMVLAIEAEGLCSLTYTPANMGFLHELVNLPDKYSPEVILPIGYPAVSHEPKRARAEARTHYEKFQ